MQACRKDTIHREPLAVRERYGMHPLGQNLLLARRLVEAGVGFVTVNGWTGAPPGHPAGGGPPASSWDMHGSEMGMGNAFCDGPYGLGWCSPCLDQGLSALLTDLRDRGLLERTLVVVMGEFGRTPKINPAGGRDHHPGVWTMIIGGGPIKGGRIVGESDELGYSPKTRPVTPAEVAATIYQGLGLDVHKELPGPQNRPLPLVDYSVQSIKELF
jgi:hypothetical protein